MPELPEVEFARGCLARWLVGKTIVGVEAGRSRVLRGNRAVLSDLVGREVLAVDRRGKWLLWRLSGDLAVAAHLGMTGKFERAEGGSEVRWSRAHFVLSSGEVVHYRDPRMFGEIRVGTLADLRAKLPPLGPDALGISAPKLRSILAGRRRPIKDVLMDQTLLAGLGNIYATEALFLSRVHPLREAATLTDGEIGRLARAITRSLRRMLAMNTGDEITYVEEARHTNPFLVYGRAGTPCPRCGTKLEKIVIAGRTSVFCPHCQPAPAKKRRAKRSARRSP